MTKRRDRTALTLCFVSILALLTGCPKKAPQSGSHAPSGAGTMGMDFCDFKAGPDDAAVKILAFYPGRHEDTIAAVKGLLEKYPKDVSVEVVDWRRPEGLAKRDANGLVCAGITINGKNAFELEIHGKTSKVLFVRGIDGEWTEEDLLAAVEKELASTK